MGDAKDAGGQGDAGMQIGAAGAGAGAAAGGAAGKLRTELESLQGFKKRVDRLLDDLGESDAEPARMSEDRLANGNLGSGFSEADGLYRVYHQIHDQLSTLSQLLSGQIGALSTAVDGAHSGYSEVDEAARERMWALQTDLRKHYDPKRDPYAKQDHGGHGEHGSHGGGHGGHGGQPGGGDGETGL